jgi:phage tail-like protein
LKDANGTGFHLLLGAADWASCTPPPAWDEPRGEATLPELLYRFPAGVADRPPLLSDRRGAGRDRFGNWYWIDADRTGVSVESAGSGETTEFWSSLNPGRRPGPAPRPRAGGFGDLAAAPSPQPLELAALVVTEDHYLVAGVRDPHGLLVFDLASGGPPAQAIWPRDVPFAPWDAAARAGGGAYVLDRDNKQLWELDRELLVLSRGAAPAGDADPFRPVDGSERTPSAPARLHARLAASDALQLDGDDLVSVEAADDGTVFVLDRVTSGPSLVRRYRDALPVGAPIALADSELGLELAGHDLALVGSSLFVADTSGNQAYRFDLLTDGGAALAHDYFPLRLFGGKAIVGTPDGAFYDFGEGWIPLTEQPRPRYALDGTYDTRAFDGREPGCVWHRVLLDACIPPDAELHVWSRAADDVPGLEHRTWRREPDPIARASGSEQPFATPLPSGYATWETLLQATVGRYAQVRLELAGDGRVSPRLRALRLSYPRSSWLHDYLPTAYLEDEASASFVERFLANLEGLETAIEDRIANAQVLFDPRTVPRETLDWLAGWFDVALDPAWSEERRRIFLRNAVQFFAYRGTTAGLEIALRLAFDTCSGDEMFTRPPRPWERGARIVETFRSRRRSPVVAAGASGGVLRLAARSGGWTPADGPDPVHDAWRAAVEATGVSLPSAAPFPLAPPPGLEDAWAQVAQRALGFVPQIGSTDVGRWRAFLRRRHGRVEAVNAAYGLTGADALASFDDAQLPDVLPSDGAALRDWFLYEAVVLPMRAGAHRFTVLLPVPLGTADSGDEERRRALAARIVDLQKPAHTVYDIRFFWSAFRLGEARLGENTIVDLGSRSPRLLADALLGTAHLGETQLGGPPPPVLRDRPSIGRDTLNP